MKYLLVLFFFFTFGKGYGQSPARELTKQQTVHAALAKLPEPPASDAFKAGEKFKGERLSDINGQKFDLKNNNGKIYVINFWFISCAPCKQEIPELNELVKQYKESGEVVFLAIALDSQRELKKFLKSTPFLYHIVGNGQYFAQKYGVDGFPTHLIVGKDGFIKFSTIGLAPNTIYWLDKTIKAQLAS
jgi:thiol-disulfide isomerase/thioredoxin